MVTPREAGGYGLDAQWSDDFHHAVHVALTGETSGYYADFEPLSALAKVCERGFFHDGTYSSFREADHGRPVDVEHLPTWRLVVCSQNHDQVGNRAVGDRHRRGSSTTTSSPARAADAGRAVHADAVPGRGVGGLDAVPVLHRHPEPATRRGDRAGPDRRVREDGLGRRASCPTRRTRRPSGARSWTGPRSSRAGTRWCSRPTGALAALRRTRPELTDPSFGSVEARADDEARVFTLRRTPTGGRDALGNPGGSLLVVNVGDADAVVEVGAVGPAGVLFATPAGVTLGGSTLRVPAHAGALVDLA